MGITKDDAQYIKRHDIDYWRAVTVPAANKNPEQFVCPACGHGKGGDGLKRAGKSPTTWHCFGCGFNGDIIDWHRHQHPEQSFKDALQEVAEIVGYRASGAERHEQPSRGGVLTPSKALKVSHPVSYSELVKNPPQKPSEAEIKAIHDYFVRYCGEFGETAAAYLEQRGISEVVATMYGMCEFKREQQAPALFTSGNAKAWPGSLIWPVGRASAETRNPWATSGNRRGVKLGPAGISDPLHALRQSAEPVFIVEGIFDAMSLTEQGHLAVALNGTGQCAMLVSGLKALRERQTLPKVVVALDNDQPGQQAQTELLTALEAAGIINSSHSWNQFKDANEMHVASLGRKATA